MTRPSPRRLVGVAGVVVALNGLILGCSAASSDLIVPPHPAAVERSPLLSSVLERAVSLRRSKKGQGRELAVGRRQSSADDPDQTSPDTIYVSYPACDSFKCSVSWPHGLNTYVNWIRSPVGGNVSITLTSNTNGTNYVVDPSVPAISQRGYCDAGSGLGVVIPGRTCGRVSFVVPPFWQPGNYTIAVQSLSKSEVAGYTDFVIISAASNSSLSSAAAALGSGTTVALQTIPGPTGTDTADAVDYSGPSLPAPTARSDVATSAASGPATGSATGSPIRASSTGGAGSASASASSSAPSASASANSGAGKDLVARWWLVVAALTTTLWLA